MFPHSSLLFTLSSPSGACGQNRAVSRQILVPYDHDLQRLQMVFFAVLRGPSWTKRSCSCRCSSPRPSVSSADKGVAVAVLRGPYCPSWIKRGVLRGPSRPFVDKKKLQLPLQFSAALRVLRGQRCCRCRSSWPLLSFVDQKRCSSRSFAALRGQKEAAVAVAVLRGPPCPPRTKVLPLPFFVALIVLRGSKEVFFAVLRGPSWTKRSCSCRCSSPRPSVSSADKGVAVAVLRGPYCPSWIKRGVLRGPSRKDGIANR